MRNINNEEEKERKNKLVLILSKLSSALAGCLASLLIYSKIIYIFIKFNFKQQEPCGKVDCKNC